MKYILQVLLIFTICVSYSFSQQNQKGTFEVQDEKVLIHYSLTAEPETEYEISVVLRRTGNSSFSYEPENLTGDIGEGKFTSGNKTIVWVLTGEETEKFDGDDFYFEIKVNKIEGGGIAWYYYVGAMVLGGGAAAVLIGGKKTDETTPSTTSFPLPPVRP